MVPAVFFFEALSASIKLLLSIQKGCLKCFEFIELFLNRFRIIIIGVIFQKVVFITALEIVDNVLPNDCQVTG